MLSGGEEARKRGVGGGGGSGGGGGLKPSVRSGERPSVRARGWVHGL